MGPAALAAEVPDIHLVEADHTHLARLGLHRHRELREQEALGTGQHYGSEPGTVLLLPVVAEVAAADRQTVGVGLAAAVLRTAAGVPVVLLEGRTAVHQQGVGLAGTVAWGDLVLLVGLLAGKMAGLLQQRVHY